MGFSQIEWSAYTGEPTWVVMDVWTTFWIRGATGVVIYCGWTLAPQVLNLLIKRVIVIENTFSKTGFCRH